VVPLSAIISSTSATIIGTVSLIVSTILVVIMLVAFSVLPVYFTTATSAPVSHMLRLALATDATATSLTPISVATMASIPVVI